jgi:AcrR family transcriptional regulator
MVTRTRTTDEQLLTAAREVFLRDGVDAPTSAVAAHAGVSEALIFKRFGTRDELITRAFARPTARWHALLTDEPLDVPGTLEEVGLAMIEEMRQDMPVTMLAWSRNPVDHWAGHAGEPPPVTGMKILAAWFERQMRAGRVRRSDPELLARVFSGSIVAFSMSEMTGLAAHMPLAATTFVRGLVAALWHGADPRP